MVKIFKKSLLFLIQAILAHFLPNLNELEIDFLANLIMLIGHYLLQKYRKRGKPQKKW